MQEELWSLSLEMRHTEEWTGLVASAGLRIFFPDTTELQNF